MTAQPHVLVVEPPIAEGHYQVTRIECPGVDDNCRAWDECRRDHTDGDIDEMENERPVHGQEHRRVGSLGWCVPTDKCWLQITEIADEVADWSLDPGRYHFDWRAEDDGEYVTFLTVTPIDDAAADAAEPTS